MQFLNRKSNLQNLVVRWTDKVEHRSVLAILSAQAQIRKLCLSDEASVRDLRTLAVVVSPL